MSGPFLKTYLEFLYFPAPVLTFLDFLTFASSSPTPKAVKTESNDLVVGCFKLSITNGNSGILSTLCPLAITRGVTAEAANAAATACLL